MVWKKASILRFLMLVCFGISLLAFSCKGVNDGVDARSTGISADNPIPFRTSVAADTFAKRTSELDQDLIGLGVKLEDGFISVNLRRNYVDWIVLPLYSSKKELNFSASQGPECLEENQHWQFSYPTDMGRGKGRLNIIWEERGYRKLSDDGDLNPEEAIYNSPSKFMNISLISSHMDISNEGRNKKDRGEVKVALEPGISDVKGYFEMNFSIKNVVAKEVSVKNGKCDLTLKFDANDYKLRATSSTPVPTTEKTRPELEITDANVTQNDFSPSKVPQTRVETLNSILIWIIVVPIVGLICFFILTSILVWYFMLHRAGSASNDYSTKLEAVVSSARATSPTIAFQATEISGKETYGSKRSDAKQKKKKKQKGERKSKREKKLKKEKKPNKKSPREEKAAGKKKGKGVKK